MEQGRDDRVVRPHEAVFDLHPRPVMSLIRRPWTKCGIPAKGQRVRDRLDAFPALCLGNPLDIQNLLYPIRTASDASFSRPGSCASHPGLLSDAPMP